MIRDTGQDGFRNPELIMQGGCNDPARPPSYPCQTCKGSGTREVMMKSSIDLRGPFDGVVNDLVTSKRGPCPDCDGRGVKYVHPGQRVNIEQDGEFVGSAIWPLTINPAARFLVDMRPGDYGFSVKKGVVRFVANAMLGPGDIQSLEGFARRLAE